MVLFQSAKQFKIIFVHFSSVIKLAAPEMCQPIGKFLSESGVQIIMCLPCDDVIVRPKSASCMAATNSSIVCDRFMMKKMKMCFYFKDKSN